ncbi:MAG: arsenite methyltransferase [Deltaproteobacteria bacterium]|nr:arsenite methyltransferase [Deltaproteobacteria bacterium]
MSSNPETKSAASSADEVRREVSRAYADAVTGRKIETAKQNRVFAAIAGYDGEELSSLPADAVQSSFGCGNPLAFAGVREGQTVVDLGSGAGIDLLIASRMVGPTGRVIGVDMTDEMIERARANVAEAGATNVEIRKGVIEQLPVEDASVDWVISNCVINLSPEKPRVFSEIARVLRPGGTMRVSDIVVSDLPAWVREMRQMYSSCVAGAISEDDYLAGLREAGLTDVEVVERLVYDRTQLRAFIATELKDASTCGCCGGGSSQTVAPEVADRIAEEVEGKIWSAKVVARKA